MLIVNFEPMFPRIFLEDLLVIQYGQEIKDEMNIDTRMRFIFKKPGAVCVDYVFRINKENGQLSTYCYTDRNNKLVSNNFYTSELNLPKDLSDNNISYGIEMFVKKLIDNINRNYSNTILNGTHVLFDHDLKDIVNFIIAAANGDI